MATLYLEGINILVYDMDSLDRNHDYETYIQELEEQLYEWDNGLVSWEIELGKIHQVIMTLMRQTFESTDSQLPLGIHIPFGGSRIFFSTIMLPKLYKKTKIF